jgi:cation/acetate symporter
MVGLAFAVAASANFPALFLALTWRRFNTAGAVTGVLFGVISSIGLIILSPTVWPGPDGQGSPVSLENPGIISIPLGFLGCWIGTMLSREETTDRSFDELVFRAETGLGAEVATRQGTTARRRTEDERSAVPA